LARQQLEELVVAIEHYETAICLRPDHVNAWNNLALAYMTSKNSQGVFRCYSELSKLHTCDSQFCMRNLLEVSLELLRHGEWTSYAWQGYECRWHCGLPLYIKPSTPFPEWDGANMAGKRLLLWYEQGNGDNIMMFRYAIWLSSRGVDVTVLAPSRLTPLFRRCHEDLKIIEEIDPVVPYDAHRSMMGLLQALQVSPNSILQSPAYLFPRMEPRPPAMKVDKLQVGLVWAGNSGFPNDHNRSLPHFRILSPLLELPGCQFHSLYIGSRMDELEGFAIGNPVVDFQDFDDTAAYIQHIDLVISVDTAVAHLAGALGKPVWVLLPNPAEWRWYPYGEATPWYPSARLFVQKSPGDWGEVIDRVAIALRGLLSS
jgi:hypothetical protein